MSQTDELRALLKEAGVEFQSISEYITDIYHDGHWIRFWEYMKGSNEGNLVVETKWLSPQQAIDATLGRGECHKVRVEMPIEAEMHCSECGRFLGFAGDIGAWPYNFCPNCGRRVVE